MEVGVGIDVVHAIDVDGTIVVLVVGCGSRLASIFAVAGLLSFGVGATTISRSPDKFIVDITDQEHFTHRRRQGLSQSPPQ